MRMRLAAILLAAISLPALAQGTGFDDPTLGVRIDLLPEVELKVPADRTEFSVPGTVSVMIAPALPPEIASAPVRRKVPQEPVPAVADHAQAAPGTPSVLISAPDLPAVVVAIPDERPSGQVASKPGGFIRIQQLPEPADAAAAIAALPKRAIPAALPLLQPPPVPPKALAIAPPPRVDTPAAAPKVADDWREQLERGFAAVTNLGALAPQAQAQVRAFYESREGRPLFSEAGQPNAIGRAVLAVAARAEEHGLDPRRTLRLVEASQMLDAAAREVALAQIAVSYARDARGGRLNPLAVSRLITATPTLPEAGAVLSGLATAADPAMTLEAWNPQHEGYRRLKASLAGLRANPEYTASLRGRAGNLIADISANMERWRWLPTNLGNAYVMVNIPAYHLEMHRDGRVVFATRVVVGKPTSPTPVFSHQMEYLVVNPYWNVPPSIALKEYLPLLQKNPYALQARGLEIVSRGRVVDPSSVDWSRIGRSVAIRQPPGERNALGNIKFMFPNDHAVYLHDTPSRGLFSAARRAYSHGCVRVQNPFALASAVSGWDEGRLRGMVGGGERRLGLPGDVHVHLAYFTTEVAADGSITQREDIYGHNRKVKALLGL